MSFQFLLFLRLLFEIFQSFQPTVFLIHLGTSHRAREDRSRSRLTLGKGRGQCCLFLNPLDLEGLG